MYQKLQLTAALLFLMLFSTIAFGQKRYEFTPNVRDAYEKVFSLRFDEAANILSLEKKIDPDNITIYFVEDYLDFFRVFINEDFAEFERLLPNKDKRLSIIKSGDRSSPYYLYMQAEVKLHWALLRLKFEQNFQAALEIRKAFKHLESNEAKFPDFIATKKSLGVLHALIETIPDKYRKLAKFVGVTGTIEQGIGELNEVMLYARKNDFIFEEETLVMYAFLMLHVGNQTEEAWSVLRNGNLDTRNNPLACFAMANMQMQIGRNDEAIVTLQNRPVGSQYHPFHYLDYMLGLAKLYRMDKDADVYLKRYVNNFKGQNYIKEAYQKLAWYELLFNSESSYKNQMANCRQYGEAISDEDKKAYKEAIYGPVPNKTLLKARLFFDGGYYDKAEKVLSVKTVSDFTNNREKIEYYYRFGRIYHKMNHKADAKKYYDLTIELGKDQPYYFACNAALQMGILKESAGEYDLALDYFDQCLSMRPDEYKNSLHGKAKAGKNRVKGK
ncbi:MAG: hypothetical protein AAF502_05265 [Bacteroidota bacterium]